MCSLNVTWHMHFYFVLNLCHLVGIATYEITNLLSDRVYFLLQILIAHTMCKSLLFVGTFSVIPFALALFIALCLYLWWQNIFNWMLHIIMILYLFQNALYMLTIWRNCQWMDKSISTLIYQVWDQAMVSVCVCVCVCARVQNVQLNAQAAHRIHKAAQTMYFNILYYITEHSTC